MYIELYLPVSDGLVMLRKLKSDQFIIERSYLEDTKILRNFVLGSAIFTRARKYSVDGRVENRRGDCIVPQEETKERNLERKKGN